MRAFQLPKDWSSDKLEKLTTRILDGTHATPSYQEYGVPFYSVESITNNDFTNTKYISNEDHQKLIKRCEPEKGDILMTRIGSIGDTKLIDWDVNASIYVSLALIKPNEKIDTNYLYTYTKFFEFKRELYKRTLQNAVPQKINLSEISKVEICYPKSLEEQKKIANILSTWDRAIDLNNDYITNTKKTYQIVSRLIYSDCYLKSDTNYHYQIKDILKEEVLKTTKNSEYDVLSSTKENVVKQSDYFNRQIASTNNIGYKILKKDRIVMSPQNAWMGNINYNSDFEIGIVSPSYKVFVIDGCESNYIKHLIKTERFINLIDSMSIQGASIVRKNLNIDDFLEAEIYLPSINNQKKYGKVLDAIKEKIKLLETKQYYLNNQKKGLMQQLLTGKIRVQS